MPLLTTTRNYEDGEVLVRADLDAFLDDIEAFLNAIKINDDNIQNSGINGALKLLNQSVVESKIANNAVTVNKLAAASVTTAKVVDGSITLAKLASEVILKLLPPGVIQAYGGTTAPSGWLLCHGAQVSRTTYSALFAVIGTTFGNGDGSTTFHLPDFRGRFLRGADLGIGRDANAGTRTAMNAGGNTGDAIGTIQPDATKLPAAGFTANSAGSHGHNFIFNAPDSGTTIDGLYLANQSYQRNSANRTVTSSVQPNGAHTHTISGGDAETRPINAAVNFIIKY